METDAKNILGLHLPTDPRWVNLASMSLEEILTDHAYCEQKAATSCISLIQRYPDKEKLVTELAPIVTEEWGHFRLVLHELQKRDLQEAADLLSRRGWNIERYFVHFTDSEKQRVRFELQETFSTV